MKTCKRAEYMHTRYKGIQFTKNLLFVAKSFNRDGLNKVNLSVYYIKVHYEMRKNINLQILVKLNLYTSSFNFTKLL